MPPSLASVANTASRGANLQCPVCSKWFETYPKKDAHQRSEGHFKCSVCDAKFHDDAAVGYHVQREHKPEQEIECPGCRTVFTSAGGWMSHIEAYQCTSIFPSTLEARQKKRQEFTDALARLEEDPVDLSGVVSHVAKADTWRDDPILKTLDGHDNFEPHHGESVDQNYTQPEDFPRLATQEFRVGDSKQPDLLTADAPGPKPLQTKNAWAQKKNLFPTKAEASSLPARSAWASGPPPALSAHPGLAQTQDHNAKVRVIKPSTVIPARADPWAGMQQASPSSNERILDPDHPDFNAGLFYEPILAQFKCPHKNCNKKFKTAQGLTGHLKSPAHRGEPITCPACRGKFNSKTAMVQHMESSITKCGIRESDRFRELLAQLTGGILDVKLVAAAVAGPLEDRADADPSETLARDVPRMFVDEKALAELRIGAAPSSTPGGARVPGAEKREDRPAQKRAGRDGGGWSKQRSQNHEEFNGW